MSDAAARVDLSSAGRARTSVMFEFHPGTTTGASRTATTCRMEEAGVRFRVRDLRAGTPTCPTFTHTMQGTRCRAGELSTR